MMAEGAAKQRMLLAVLLLSAAAVASLAAGSEPSAADKAPAPVGKHLEVDAYALVQVPGCNVGKPNSLVLPPGVSRGVCLAGGV